MQTRCAHAHRLVALTTALTLSVFVAGCAVRQGGPLAMQGRLASEAATTSGDEELYVRLAALEARVDELSTTCAHGQSSREQLGLLRDLVLEVAGNDRGESRCAGLERMMAQETARVAELSLRYGERHPDMLAARARQAAIEARRVEACSEAATAE